MNLRGPKVLVIGSRSSGKSSFVRAAWNESSDHAAGEAGRPWWMAMDSMDSMDPIATELLNYWDRGMNIEGTVRSTVFLMGTEGYQVDAYHISSS